MNAITLTDSFQAEYNKWLEHHATFNPSKFQKQKIADNTGRVPMYLSQMIKYFRDCDNVQRAMAQYTAKLGRECESELKSFYSINCDHHSDRMECAKELLRGVRPSYMSEYMDHRYFYVQDGKSHAVCGIARATLAIILRAKSKIEAEAYFLSEEYIQACLKSNNPSVKGFQAEQIAMSAINKNGFNLCQEVHPDMATSFFETSEAAVLTDQPCCHYIPKPFNYKFIDSLVRILKLKKNSLVAESADMYAIQYTLQSYADHKGSLNFFDEEFQPWERNIRPGKDKIHWHFVWILTKVEATKQRTKKNSTHMKMRQHKNTSLSYTEWFFPFEEVVPKLWI